MRKVLIIGGTGLLSGAVASEAIRQGMDVTCINRGKHVSVEGAHTIVSDKDDYERLEEKLKGLYFDAVVDFLVRHKEELQKSFEHYSNYTKQYVFISTTMVYNSSLDMLFDEDAPKVQSQWPYSVEKWECEELLMKIAALSNCNYTIVRPGITYDDTRIPYDIMPTYGKHGTLVARIKAGKPIIALNGGKYRCNMMRAEDFARGVVGLLGVKEAYNEAYNVCGDECPSFKQVLDVVASIIGVEYKIVDVSAKEYAELAPSRQDDILGRSFNYVCSNKKIKTICPTFSPQIPLEEGLKRVVEAYVNSNYQQGMDYEWDAQCDKVAKSKDVKTVRFIDYLGNASLNDKMTYYRVGGNKFFLVLFKCIRKAQKIISLLHKR